MAPIGSGRAAFSGVSDAIPDSENLQARYDFREENGSTPVTDLTGNGFDLSGSYTGVGGSINGNQAGVFDGTDDKLASSAFTTVTQPYSIYLVFQLSSSNSDVETYIDLADGGSFVLIRQRDSNWNVFAGSDIGLEAGTVDTNAHYQTVEFDGSNSVNRIDGSQLVSGDAGSTDMDSIALGARDDEGSFRDLNIGEVLVYTVGHDSATRNDIEQYLIDGWGF